MLALTYRSRNVYPLEFGPSPHTLPYVKRRYGKQSDVWLYLWIKSHRNLMKYSKVGSWSAKWILYLTNNGNVLFWLSENVHIPVNLSLPSKIRSFLSCGNHDMENVVCSRFDQFQTGCRLLHNPLWWLFFVWKLSLPIPTRNKLICYNWVKRPDCWRYGKRKNVKAWARNWYWSKSQPDQSSQPIRQTYIWQITPSHI